MRRIHYLFAFLLIITLSNCKKKEIVDTLPVAIYEPRIDISDAQALFVVDHELSPDGNLYKVTSNNEVKKVNFINTSGTNVFDNPIESKLGITGFLNGSNFIIVKLKSSVYWDINGEQVTKSYVSIVEKETGKIVNLTNTLSDFNSSKWFNKSYNLQNSSANVYFMAENVVYQIKPDFSFSRYSPSDILTDVYFVDYADNLLFKNSQTDELMLKLAGGDLINLTEMLEPGSISFWLGSDQKFYIFRDDIANGTNVLERLNISGPIVLIESVLSDVDPDMDLWEQDNYFKLNYQDSVLFIHKQSSPGNISAVYKENTQEFSNVSYAFQLFDSFIQVEQTEDNYYPLSDCNIYKFYPSYTHNRLLTHCEYGLKMIAIGPWNKILLYAYDSYEESDFIAYLDNSLIVRKIKNETGLIQLEFLY